MKIRTSKESGLVMVKSILESANLTWVTIGKTEINVTNSDNEASLRSYLQKHLDINGFDYTSDFVLVEGNSIWSLDKIITELKRIKKAGTTAKISKYFYNFMHLNFTIAHYNIEGWKNEYPTYNDVKNILEQATTPHWKTDVKNILDDFH